MDLGKERAEGYLMKLKRKWIPALLAAVLLISGCGAETGGKAPEKTSGDISAGTSSERGETSSEETVSQDGQAPENAQTEENKLPDDGKIRILSDWQGSTSVVFCGNKKVYDGDGYAFIPSGGESTAYFALQEIAPEEENGEGNRGSYHVSLFNADGEKLLDGLGDGISICGNWLFSEDDGFAASDSSGMQPKVYDLTTLREADFPTAGYAMQAGDYLAVNSYADQTACTVFRADDLSMIRGIDGGSASTDLSLPGMFRISIYDEESETASDFVYDPKTGKDYNDIYEVCGKNLILQAGTGETAYQVVNVSTGETVEETDKQYTVYTDQIKVWCAPEDEGGFYIDAPCYSAPRWIDYVNQTDYTRGIGETGWLVSYDSGRGDLLSADGEMILSVNPADYGYESGRVGYLTDDILEVTPEDWGTPGLTLIYENGHAVDFSRYTDIYPLYGSKYLSAGYQFGNTYLTDLLDKEGNVVLEGLKNVTAAEETLISCEKGFYRGFMDMEGNWLYKESVFSSANDETDDAMW